MHNGLPESVQSLMFHVGVPASPEGVDLFKSQGGKIVFVLTPEEKEKYQLKPDEAGITWSSDEAVKAYLFENFHLWKGCTINGNEEERLCRFAKILSELVELHNFDTSSITFLTKDQTPTRNAFQNFRWVEDGIALKRARGRGVGTAAYIIAAGPSLNHQWKELKRIRQMDPNACFMVAGRTYKKAMEEGVVPQFVIEVEQFDWDDRIFMFAPMPHPETVLCFPLTVCPGVPKAWPSEKLVLVDHNMASLFGWKVGEESIDGGNSILHHMMNLSLWLGCNPICLAGVDLGYPNGYKEETHATGTFHPWPGDIMKAEKTHQEALTLPANDGGYVQSSMPYQNFRLFLEIQIQRAKAKNPNLQVLNFSPRGQKIVGAPYVPIESWGIASCPSSSDSLSASSASSALAVASPSASAFTAT